MKTKRYILTLIVALLSAFSLPPSALLFAAPLGTAFTYQGRLNDTNGPVTGYYDFFFALYDSATGDTGQIGSTMIPYWSKPVTNGLFTVSLDFGDVFTGNATWLQILVRTNYGGAFTTLTPRQPLTPAPYAMMAGSASNLLGTLPAASLAGTYSNEVTFGNAANSFSGNGSGLASLNANNLSSGTVAEPLVASTIARDSEVFSIVLANDGPTSGLNADLLDSLDSTRFWKLAGNAGTTPGTDFLGTTDNQPLEFKVNGVRALRLSYALDYFGNPAPSVVAGVLNNSDSAGTWIGGRGNNIGVNSDNSAIGGGYGNSIADDTWRAIIAGGYESIIAINSDCSAIGGGNQNNIERDSWYATIAGGQFNVIGTNAYYNVIGGGYTNRIAALSRSATIAGGQRNDIGTNSDYSAIGGGTTNNIGNDSWGSTIAGGFLNDIGNNADYSAIAGG
jgi:hypothetical protein